jgi:hypothetical protein
MGVDIGEANDSELLAASRSQPDAFSQPATIHERVHTPNQRARRLEPNRSFSAI